MMNLIISPPAACKRFSEPPPRLVELRRASPAARKLMLRYGVPINTAELLCTLSGFGRAVQR